VTNGYPAPGRSDPAPLADDIAIGSIRAQLARITASRTFEHAPVLRHFLAHIVDHALEGKADQLKEYALGIDVFARGASFDPRVDTIVRVQARRLRSKLEGYYHTEGHDDPIVIEMPKGHYVPRFRRSNQDPSGTASSRSASSTAGWWTSRIGLASGVLLATILVIVVGRATLWQDRLPEPAPSVADAAALAAEGESASPVRIAVALFENRTSDPSLDGLGQRLAEQVIGVLAQLSDADVVPRPVHSNGPSTEPGAMLLVTGAYFAHDDQVELQARVAEAATGRLLASTPLITASRLRLSDALERIEQQVAGAIAIHLDDFFGGLDVISHAPTLDAYREYRVGLEIFQSDYPRALAHLERALESAPAFLPPHVVMFFAHTNLGHQDEAESVLARMEGYSDRFTQPERLLVEFLRANWDRRREQAVRVLEDLEELVPTSLLVNYNLVEKFVLANRPQAAVDTYNRQRFGERSLRHSIGSYRHDYLSRALHMIGAYDRELAQVRLAQQYAPGVLRFEEAEARALVALGRLGDANGTIDRSQAMAPVAGWSNTPGEVMEHTVRELRTHGFRREALKLATRAVEWYQARPGEAREGRGYRAGLARVLYLAERWHEADAIFGELVKAFPDDPVYLASRGQIAARVGDVRRARGVSAELEAFNGRASPRAWYGRACIAALLGDQQRAVDLLREAITQGFPYGLEIHNNPDLESLRNYRPFVELVRPTG
jgi:tetratricopeptide (TPR) repeat protein